MNEHPNFFAIIPATIRYDRKLPANAKLLYGEITALCNKEGYCWASNRYFADLYGTDNSTISKWIKSLETNGYITTEIVYKAGTKQIDQRRIRLTAAVPPLPEKERAPTPPVTPVPPPVTPPPPPEQVNPSPAASAGIENKSTGIEKTPGGIEIKSTGIEKMPGGIESKSTGIEKKSGGIEKTPKRIIHINTTYNTTNTTTPISTDAGALVPGGHENFTRIKCRWIKNYKNLYGHAPPRPAVADQLYPLVIQKLKTFGCESILSALDAGMSEPFCLERGYNFKLFTSDEVISRLLHKPTNTENSFYPQDTSDGIYDISCLIGRPGVPLPF